MWRHFKDGHVKTSDEVCWKKRGRRSKGDIFWWNEEVKKAVSRKKTQKNHDKNLQFCGE